MKICKNILENTIKTPINSEKIKELNKKENMIENFILKDAENINFENLIFEKSLQNNIYKNIIKPFKNSSERFFRTILFKGPPGNGKTIISKAILNELGKSINFLYVSIGNMPDKCYLEFDKFIENLFNFAIKNQPCIIFIDEIDTIFKLLNKENYEISKEKLLTKIDYLNKNSKNKIIFIATENITNNLEHDILNKFEINLYFPIPNLEQKILFIKSLLKDLKYNISDSEFSNFLTKLENFSYFSLYRIFQNSAFESLRNPEFLKLAQNKEIPEIKISDFDLVFSQFKPIF